MTPSPPPRVLHAVGGAGGAAPRRLPCRLHAADPGDRRQHPQAEGGDREGWGGVLNLGVGGCEEGGYGALCPKNKGFGGPGGSQGGDLGVSVGLVGWVWGLWCHLGVGDGVWRGCVPQK